MTPGGGYLPESPGWDNQIDLTCGAAAGARAAGPTPTTVVATTAMTQPRLTNLKEALI